MFVLENLLQAPFFLLFTANISLTFDTVSDFNTTLLDKNDSSCLNFPLTIHPSSVSHLHMEFTSVDAIEDNFLVLEILLRPTDCQKVVLMQDVQSSSSQCGSQNKIYKKTGELLKSAVGSDRCYFRVPTTCDTTVTQCEFSGHFVVNATIAGPVAFCEFSQG